MLMKLVGFLLTKKQQMSYIFVCHALLALSFVQFNIHIWQSLQLSPYYVEAIHEQF